MFKSKILLGCALLLSSPALAESPIDGTWKMVVSSAKFAGKPVEMTLAKGDFSCVSCEKPYTIKADGAFHARPGISVDESSVQAINDRTIKMASRKGGKLTGESLVTVAADGATRKVEWVEYSPNGTVSRGMDLHQRVGAAPTGAHLVSGKWQMAKLEQVDDSANLVTFKTAGDSVTMSTPDGYGYVARLGGPAVPVMGDRSGGMVQLAQIGPNTFTETSLLDGKVRNVTTININPNGTASMRSENKVTGNSSQAELVRQ